MVRSTVILPFFGAVLGFIFAAITIWILNSPSTHLVYSFFSTPRGACLVEVKNDIPAIVLVLIPPFFGAAMGYIVGLVIDRIGWGVTRR